MCYLRFSPRLLLSLFLFARQVYLEKKKESPTKSIVVVILISFIQSPSYLFNFDTIFFFFSELKNMNCGKAEPKIFYHQLFSFSLHHRLSLSTNRERSTPEVSEGEGKMPEKPEHGSKIFGDELKCKFD